MTSVPEPSSGPKVARPSRRERSSDRTPAVSLAGKVALVTGSSRGIGAAIARVFAREGAAVAVHGRDRAAMDAVRADIEQSGQRAVAIAADLARFDEIETMRVRAEETLGPIDILVTNAGGAYSVGPLEELGEAEWRAELDGNLTATFLTMKSVLPGMKARRAGSIVTVSSSAARLVHPSAPAAYAAAKAGIETLTRIAAAQAGPFGVRVNCISPETILTERNDQRIPPPVKEKLASAHPLRRLGMPEDVANAALFLASDAAGWMTGLVVDVAGGGTIA